MPAPDDCGRKVTHSRPKDTFAAREIGLRSRVSRGRVGTRSYTHTRARNPKGRRPGTVRVVTIFRPSEEARVRELLGALERHVELFVALGPEETPLPGARDIDFAGETVRLCEEIASLTDAVSVRVEEKPPGFE